MTDPNLTTTEPAAIVYNTCPYCGHPPHPEGIKCAVCKCKARPGFWKKFFGQLGNAIGEAKFGGS